MIETVTLRSGVAMPRLGLGTWPMDDREAEAVVGAALAAGHRLVDTAYAYGNEAGVGRGVRASGVPRDEVFVTSKLNAEWHGVAEVRAAFAMSAEALGLDRLDLLLIHWPNPWLDRYVAAWEGLVALREEGLVRAIGVSNFTPAHLERLIAATGVVPDVNQVEVHPTFTNDAVRAFDASRGIVTQAWSALGRGGALLRDPAVTEIAARHGRTPAQVVLRWHLDEGLAPVAKSSRLERLRENLAIFDFTLTAQERAALSALDRGPAAATHDPDTFGH